MRLIDYFDRGYTLNPDGVCLKEGDAQLTYRVVWRATHRIARRLRELDLGREAVVAVLSNNHLYTMVVVLGILRSGYVWLPINARNGRDEIDHALRTHDTRFIFHQTAFSDLLHELLPGVPGIRGACIIDAQVEDARSLRAWISAAADTLIDIDQSPDDLICIRSTSGTTGPSKGVMVTGRVYATMFANFFSLLPVTRRPVYLAAAPLSHGAGLLCFAAMAFGGTSVILAKAAPEAILQAIGQHAVTHMFLPPTLLYMLLDSPALPCYRYTSLQYLIYAGAPMSVERLKQALAAFGPVLAQGYGQAEAPFFCTILTPQEHSLAGDPVSERRLSSCGRAAPFVRVSVMNDTGVLLGPSQTGEVVVRGDIVMKGYYGNPEATAAVSNFGWHHTGDVGYLDDDGYLYLVDRKRDLIISGGFNIAPGEIEQVLWSHHAVADCAVIGVPDEHWGEAVKAVVELKPGMTVSAEELAELCRNRLGGMKTPKSIEFWETLPRSSVGKVLKREIRAKFWTGRARSI